MELCDKSQFEKETGVDTSNLVAKSYLASLKAKVDKINIDKPKTLPTGLGDLVNIVDNDVFKKIVHNKLVTKVNIK